MRAGLPLVELHRHLDGNIRTATILDLARRHGIPLPADTVEGLHPHVTLTAVVPDLVAFLAKFEFYQAVLVDLDAVARITRENLEDAAAEGIDYIELRFSPAFMAFRHGLDVHAVTETVCRVLAEQRPRLPVRAKLIGILSRNLPPDLIERELDAAIRFRDDGVVALDLAGNERDFPGDLFVSHFRRARDAGLHVIAHAGEASGPESIRQALDHLGAERIGHGVAARLDERLMDRLAAEGIPLEMCPTSNVQTSTVRSYADHPLPMFLRRGMCVTLNTDDPGICGVSLADEYRVAAGPLGMTEAELRTLQANALRAAFLSDAERTALSAGATVPVKP